MQQKDARCHAVPTQTSPFGHGSARAQFGTLALRQFHPWCVLLSSPHVLGEQAQLPLQGPLKGARWTGAGLLCNCHTLPLSLGSFAVIWADKMTPSMFAKRDKSEAAVVPLA